MHCSAHFAAWSDCSDIVGVTLVTETEIWNPILLGVYSTSNFNLFTSYDWALLECAEFRVEKSRRGTTWPWELPVSPLLCLLKGLGERSEMAAGDSRRRTMPASALANSSLDGRGRLAHCFHWNWLAVLLCKLLVFLDGWCSIRFVPYCCSERRFSRDLEEEHVELETRLWVLS